MKRFRLLAVRFTLMLTGLVALGALAISTEATKGVLAGGGVATLGFWVTALRAEKLASGENQMVHFRAYGLPLLKLALYALAMGWGFSLDRETFHGLFGAAVGILLLRVVLVFLGITGLDLPPEAGVDNDLTEPADESEADGTHR